MGLFTLAILSWRLLHLQRLDRRQPDALPPTCAVIVGQSERGADGASRRQTARAQE